MIVRKQSQPCAARALPPWKRSSPGCSATSGSRLFISMRKAASCAQPLHESVIPRGARIRSLGTACAPCVSFIARDPLGAHLSAAAHYGHVTVLVHMISDTFGFWVWICHG